jgi:hypothetical protein
LAGADETLQPLLDGVDGEHFVEQIEIDRAVELGGAPGWLTE